MNKAIQFAEWLFENRWFNFENGKWSYTFQQGTSISKKTYEKNYVKTTQELYSIFEKEIVQRERLNEETIEEQEQVKCDYCGRNIDDCDCL
jgi:hypothetical protein